MAVWEDYGHNIEYFSIVCILTIIALWILTFHYFFLIKAETITLELTWLHLFSMNHEIKVQERERMAYIFLSRETCHNKIQFRSFQALLKDTSGMKTRNEGLCIKTYRKENVEDRMAEWKL